MTRLETASPTTGTDRIIGLDVLRGFALYGVFLTNAFISARPMDVALKPPPTGTAELIAWGAFDLFLVTKFVALFSLLFGVGLILQCERARAKGLPFKKIYRRRLFILAAIGFIHGCFLFEGDILFVYSICGTALFLLRNQSANWLLALTAIPFGIGILLSLGWEIFDLGNTLGAATNVETEFRPQTLSQVLNWRSEEYLGWLIISTCISFNWRVLGFFFMGAAIMKFGWINASFSKQQRNTGIALTTLGLLIGLVGLYITLAFETPTLGLRIAQAMAHELGSIALSFGFAGIVLWLSHSGRLKFLQNGLSAVGRTALTNYLLQSAIINLLFMNFAFALYEQISRVEVLVWTSLIFVVQTLATYHWLRHFKMGPVEWFWRWLTYINIQLPPRNSTI